MKLNLRKLSFYSAIVALLTFSLGFATSEQMPEKAYAMINDQVTEELSVEPKDELIKEITVVTETQETEETREEVYDPAEIHSEVKEIMEQVQTYHQVITTYLNVRKEANPDSAIVDVLVNGWVVEIEKTEDNGWLLLKGGGYINGKYTKYLEPIEAMKVLEEQKTKEKPKPVFEEPVKMIPSHTEAASVTSSGDNSNTSKNESHNISAQYSDYELDLLARLVRAEAQSEPYEGKVAVAIVVLNRIASEKFPDSIHNVIYQPGQFSPVSNGSINRAADDVSRQAVQEAITMGNTLNGSLFFYNPAIATSRWLDSKATTVAIGNHVFKK